MACVYIILTTTLLLGSCLQETVGSEQHAVFSKTLIQLHSECRAILNHPAMEPEGECEQRCEFYLGRALDVVRGPVYSVYRAIFNRQIPGDACYVDRTYRCVWNWDQFNLTKVEPCKWATSVGFCFFYNYGFIDVNYSLFIRPLSLELRHIVESCSRIQQLSDEDLLDIINNGFVDSEIAGKLVRCVMIRAGLYSDADGPNLDRLEQMYGAGTIERGNFWQTAQKCVGKARVRYPNASKFGLAAYILDDCFEDFLQNMRTALIEILKNE
ncbi:general odorant-binding protein 45-like [Uranotaenia lowii]|uniref:general odorant-binding protein 45-like n=1 Tax=Uranotaenia lowii TaxID=190385 RepID=UPI002479DB4C|nr:general odorant-binding protein 45-like [Uranotaenia lowii]